MCAGAKTVDVLLDHDPPTEPCVTDEIMEPPDLAAYEAMSTPVHLAARYNITMNYKKFTKRGFPVDQVDGNGDTPLTIALENSHFNLARTLLDLGANPAEIPRKLQIFLSPHERHERLLKIRSEHWTPIESHVYLHYLRRLSGKNIPIPIFDRILRFAGHTDQLQIRRRGRMTVNEHVTQQIPRPYLMSPPILGNAEQPVQRIELHVHSRDQGQSNPGRDYSLSKLITMTRDEKMVHWQPEHKFGRNLHHWQDHRNVLNKKGEYPHIDSSRS